MRYIVEITMGMLECDDEMICIAIDRKSIPSSGMLVLESSELKLSEVNEDWVEIHCYMDEQNTIIGSLVTILALDGLIVQVRT